MITNSISAKSKFPSPFAPPDVKNSPKYCKAYAEAFHTEAANLPTEQSLCRNNKNYKRYRQYGRGEQSQLQYKELMGLKQAKDGKPMNTSYRNINFEILKVAPKIRNVVINKVANQPMRLTAKAIDPTSRSDRQRYKLDLTEFIVNKEAIEAFEREYKIGLNRPVTGDEMPPANFMEIDPFIDMNPKDVTSMEVLDMLNLIFYDNDWEQQSFEAIGDIVDTSVGIIKQYIDSDDKLRFSRAMPENCITNRCIYPDFRDLIRFGEYKQITVSELKRITNGAWGEQAYKDIAEKYAGDMKYNNTPASYFDTLSYSYAYDHEKVTVLECMWLSTDTEVYTIYNNGAGRQRVKKEAFNYRPYRGDMMFNNGQGLSDAEFNQLNAGKKSIHRREVRNVYTCNWVVDTDYVYNFGLMKNMLRSVNNPSETILPVTIVTTDFISTMGLIEQPLDQVQLNYLQFQSHIAASKPPGIAIEMNALARLGKGGQGGKKWDPKEALMMYAETGNMVYNGVDQHGNPLQAYPFKELANGLSPGAMEHFNIMLQWIEMIRQNLGINQITEGQTPPERLGASVAELSFGATDNALSHLTRAFKSLYERTARNMWYLLQNNAQRMSAEQITESLGAETYRFISLNSDLGLKEMGIKIEEGPDEATKNMITQTLNLMVENGQLPGEDAVMIQMVDNPYRQVLMIRKHRLEMERKNDQKQQALIQQQGESNTQTAIATEEAARQTQAEAFQQRMQEKQLDASIDSGRRQQEFQQELIIKRLDREGDIEDIDKEMINDILKEMLRGQVTLKAKKIANEKPKSNVSSK